MSENTVYPNTYQKPNAFVDDIMRYLTPSANLLLDVACRKILGWEKHRQTRRDRISTTQFMETSGLSRQTVLNGLEILENAKLLTPVGRPNNNGQEYELNLDGGYDMDYLKSIGKRSGNPEPDQSALAAKRRQIAMPDMAVLGGLKIRPVQKLDRSNEFYTDVELVRPLVLNSLDPQNLKPKNIDIDIKYLDELLPGQSQFTPLSLWKATLVQIVLEMPRTTFETWFQGSIPCASEQGDDELIFAIAVPTQYQVDWLTNRMTGTVTRTLTQIAGQRIVPKFVVRN